MSRPSQKTCILILISIGQVGFACVSTSATSTATTTSSTSLTSTTTPTTTTTTTTSTTTTTTSAGSCATCPMNLQQGKITDPTGIDGLATITYTMAGGCIVANIVCNSVMGRYQITIALQENPGLLFGGACATVTMPAGIVVCNAMGQWISTVTGNVQPVILCDEVNPATSAMC